jgi:hypothetical protein
VYWLTGTHIFYLAGQNTCRRRRASSTMKFQLSHHGDLKPARITLGLLLFLVLSHNPASSFSVLAPAAAKAAASQGTFRQVLSSSALAVSFSSFDEQDASSSSSSSSSDQHGTSSSIPEGEVSLGRHSEYLNLEPLYESDIRRARIEQDLVNRETFAKYGNDLWNLRKTMAKLSTKLMDAIQHTSTPNTDTSTTDTSTSTSSTTTNMQDAESAQEQQEQQQMLFLLRAKLREAESQDPELIYRLELEALQNAQREGRTKDAELHIQKAVAARSCLPLFNLEGLWVGK